VETKNPTFIYKLHLVNDNLFDNENNIFHHVHIFFSQHPPRRAGTEYFDQ